MGRSWHCHRMSNINCEHGLASVWIRLRRETAAGAKCVPRLRSRLRGLLFNMREVEAKTRSCGQVCPPLVHLQVLLAAAGGSVPAPGQTGTTTERLIPKYKEEERAFLWDLTCVIMRKNMAHVRKTEYKWPRFGGRKNKKYKKRDKYCSLFQSVYLY